MPATQQQWDREWRKSF